MKIPVAEGGPISHVISYRDYLEGRIKRSAVRRNELTREKLKAATVRLLESGGYHEIPISTFCEEAGLAKGTFYLHFADKEDLVAQVLEEYTALQVKIMPSADGSKDAYAALIVLNSWFAETFCENVGLHRSMMQLSEAIPRITKIWTDFLKGLSARYIEEVQRWSNTTLDPEFATFVTYCLWGMLDQALYAIYAVKRNPDFERLARNQAYLVQSITLFQHRALFLENPEATFDKSVEGFLMLRGRK
ncbi:TetR/AcrR family transcriptional regulator [Sphingosinicella rhizophila]|uniref:TetR/AcrR family transcriptional regulator n=1 Tax=Sphingosinicella rhizophila TaxID=3050082 RepID=A0ABU3Q5W9_9SPHN|nr:TetR/AcrR family transcriptional regulator [Sphingosinicella sp. GR2756]MDT9598806.1 TetR/AcrR family transcriptional regulator [Sphingosinicella sp. GR2756]